MNFYGISYGLVSLRNSRHRSDQPIISTILVAYLIELFPDRVGKVVADGVLDAITWSNAPPMNGFPADLKDAEAVLRGWSSACASSSRCSLSNLGNKTTGGVVGIIDSVLNTAYKTYDGTVWSQTALLVNGTLPPNVHDWSYDNLATIVFGMLFSSQNWHALDVLLSLLYAQQNNSTTSSFNSRSERIKLPLHINLISPRWSASGQWSEGDDPWSQGIYAIACGDSQDIPSNYTTSTVLDISIDASQDVSSHFGTVRSPKWYCHRWSTRAVERLSGRFDTKPKGVVLVIGNTYDHVTPFASAVSMASADRLGSKARLVQFNAIGHYSGMF